MADFDRFMQELKAKNDIADVIGSYVALDRKGGNHWACCPFHHERTPSFAVNQSEQFYHCFGCGESGDVVKFVKEIESTDFMGAVRILAARAKMEVPESNMDTEESIRKKKKRDAVAAILLDTARFYRSNLFSGDRRADAHLQYIADRQMTPSTVKQFGIGASLDYKELGEFLAGKGYQRQDILDSGVLIEDKNKRLIDAQAERLIFPIINNMDEVIGFGGAFTESTAYNYAQMTAAQKEEFLTRYFDKEKGLGYSFCRTHIHSDHFADKFAKRFCTVLIFVVRFCSDFFPQRFFKFRYIILCQRDVCAKF